MFVRIAHHINRGRPETSLSADFRFADSGGARSFAVAYATAEPPLTTEVTSQGGVFQHTTA